ncbi:twin-arginine translocation protein, TatB subunit [Ancylobacter novellus DSM 506]|uniref:Sec-independent protein translocase protein TatB n=1 Tax=Ancylobacter novellus (strain ATCC 8093 / DSM 506 / JCM 20403 / CCM 1077 / IAM 12100 / NBRC 12443 / NCIMB 10456) TaxID=639283 RepID=D6ZZ50_ANCN5|nr:Sec-independent protein translocase protein TatB [Ancylobacter novellus]ADH89186.1 twin-arginine translocation protein, TatB subunit [Ancylobacter novellus DSM 506]
MFDIGWSELLVIGIVALVVIGPKELPRVLRTVGQGIGKLRRMAGEFQGQFNEALREAELSDLKDNVASLKNDLAGLATDARNSLSEAMPTNPLQDIETDLKAPTGSVERGDLPSAEAVEAQLPPPGDLEPYPFETIEEEVRSAAAQVPAEPGKSEPAKAEPAKAEVKPVAAAAPPTNAPPAAPEAKVEAKPKRTRIAAKPAAVPPEAAPKRVARKPAASRVEPEIAEAVAALDAPAPAATKPVKTVAKSAAKSAAKPRVRAKAPGGEGPAA